MEEPPDRDHLLDLIEWVGWDRLLFASDYPHWDFDDPSQMLPRIDEARRQVFHDNARALARAGRTADAAVRLRRACRATTLATARRPADADGWRAAAGAASGAARRLRAAARIRRCAARRLVRGVWWPSGHAALRDDSLCARCDRLRRVVGDTPNGKTAAHTWIAPGGPRLPWRE